MYCTHNSKFQQGYWCGANAEEYAGAAPFMVITNALDAIQMREELEKRAVRLTSGHVIPEMPEPCKQLEGTKKFAEIPVSTR